MAVVALIPIEFRSKESRSDYPGFYDCYETKRHENEEVWYAFGFFTGQAVKYPLKAALATICLECLKC